MQQLDMFGEQKRKLQIRIQPQAGWFYAKELSNGVIVPTGFADGALDCRHIDRVKKTYKEYDFRCV
jgi:hypothetical protein